MKELTLQSIAYIKNDYQDSFAVPRQSGRVKNQSKIIFYPKYRNPDALREIEGFSHLWLIFDFSLSHIEEWSPTVRPPRLGGNKKVGVFASRSPYRPNPIGLSSVKLLRVEKTERFGVVLVVQGADLYDGTPILDIKPYLPSTDCHLDAKGGYAELFTDYKLEVEIPLSISQLFSKDKLNVLIGCLSEDPRPAYHKDGRNYSFNFNGYDVHFVINGDKLTVTGADKL